MNRSFNARNYLTSVLILIIRNNEAKKSRTITVSLINRIIRMILDLSVCFQQCFFIIQRRVILKKIQIVYWWDIPTLVFLLLKSLGIHCLHYTQLCVCLYLKLVLIKLRTNGRNIVGQQLRTLLDVTCCVCLHTLLHVVGCCCVLLRKVWARSNFSANNSQHFFCSVIAEA